MATLSISRAWDETRDVIARDGGLLITLALALFVLPGVVSEITTPAAPAGQFPKPGYWTVVTAIAILIALLGQIAVIRLAIGSRLTVGEAIAHGARRAPIYFLATLLWTAPFLIVGAVLLAIVGRNPNDVSAAVAVGLLVLSGVMLFFAIRMLMTSAIASSEPLGPVAILRRSWDLTSGNWWRLFGFFALFLIAVVIVVTAVGVIGGIIAKLAFGDIEPMTVGALFVALLTQVVSAAVSVVLMVMLARIYVQLAGDGAGEASVPTSGT